MAITYDRSAEDLGNVVALEHVNTRVNDQRLATIFYLMGMGFTRDPYINFGISNMWINLGRSQFHLPTGEPQVVRGHVGIVVPNREALLNRLTKIKAELDGTQFGFVEADEFVEAVSPWGNRFRCYEPDARFGRVVLGMPYVELDVPVGTAPAIARFYSEVIGTNAKLDDASGTATAICSVGDRQDLIFRETDRPLAEYDGHHVQVYVADFSGPHERLDRLGLITEESSDWQYRFKDIVDPENGELAYVLEHEVRSMTHPMYLRPLVNRDASGHYAPSHEDLRWTSIDAD